MAKISSKNLAEAIYKATLGKSGDNLNLILKRGVKMLSDKRMLGQSENVLKALQEIIDKKNNTIRIRVISAKTLDSGQRHEIEKKIKEKHKVDKVESMFSEKSELLGGVRIEVGDEVIDSTYKNKLDRLEKFLIQK